MRSPYGWIKPAGKGSSYCTYSGQYWIVKLKGQWVLMQMSSQSLKRKQEVFGKFGSLMSAVKYYENEVKS